MASSQSIQRYSLTPLTLGDTTIRTITRTYLGTEVDAPEGTRFNFENFEESRPGSGVWTVRYTDLIMGPEPQVIIVPESVEEGGPKIYRAVRSGP